MTSTTPPDDWWPDWLFNPAAENPLADEMVKVAEIAEATIDSPYHELFTALVPLDRLSEILERPRGIGHTVETTGPHPTPFRGQWDYTPRFWVWSGNNSREDLEPIAVCWTSSSETVLMPDQGFLMTYALIPRVVSTPTGLRLNWDDLSEPVFDVIVSRMVSKGELGSSSHAYISVNREYVRDYATIRNQALVQVYYVSSIAKMDENTRVILAEKDGLEFARKGHLLALNVIPGTSRTEVKGQAWGVRLLVTPSETPISTRHESSNPLQWPGIQEPISRSHSNRPVHGQVVYVLDSVLNIYEGKPEFSIHPETGSVFYGGRWRISRTTRIGRDIIQVDLKDLYEGAPMSTIRHWHSYAVDPPSNIETLRQLPNVGSIARRIVYSLTSLGEELARITYLNGAQFMSGWDIVGLDRHALENTGWWNAEHVEPVTRHIPIDLRVDQFVDRCKDLYRFVGEAFKERQLRDILTIFLNTPREEIQDYRSIRLLDLIVKMANLANHTGLVLPSQAGVLQTRLADEQSTNHVKMLFALNDLRQIGSHRFGTSKATSFEAALSQFDLQATAFASGWGPALDAIYDGIARALESITMILKAGIQQVAQ